MIKPRPVHHYHAHGRLPASITALIFFVFKLERKKEIQGPLRLKMTHFYHVVCFVSSLELTVFVKKKEQYQL